MSKPAQAVSSAPIGGEDRSAAVDAGGGLWPDVWKRFKHNPIALAGFYVVCILAFMAVFADFIANDKPYYLEYQGKFYFPIVRSYLVGAKLERWPAELLNVDFKKLSGAKAVYPPIPYRPSNINLLEPLESPSRNHFLGTDKLGRDVAAGMVHGSRISLSIGFVAVGIAVVIGVVLGAIAGYFGSWIDLVISRLFEIMLSIPTFFLYRPSTWIDRAQEGEEPCSTSASAASAPSVSPRRTRTCTSSARARETV